MPTLGLPTSRDRGLRQITLTHTWYSYGALQHLLASSSAVFKDAAVSDGGRRASCADRWCHLGHVVQQICGGQSLLAECADRGHLGFCGARPLCPNSKGPKSLLEPLAFLIHPLAFLKAQKSGTVHAHRQRSCLQLRHFGMSNITLGTSGSFPQPHVASVEATTKPILVLLPVLGLTWVCGILVHLSVTWAYIFIMLNSLQGLYIFLVYALYNSELSGELPGAGCSLSLRTELLPPCQLSVEPQEHLLGDGQIQPNHPGEYNLFQREGHGIKEQRIKQALMAMCEVYALASVKLLSMLHNSSYCPCSTTPLSLGHLWTPKHLEDTICLSLR
ncbi:hypothetical protein L345_16518, partial [Ophiophagus hannah]